MTGLEVLDPGPRCTVQDLGRVGHGRLAVGLSGAFDRAALRLGNRLLGNDESASGLESVLAGPVLRALRSGWVCVTGADGPVTIDGRPVDRRSPLWLPAGSVLAVGTATRGLRSYVTVRGGIALPAVLGSTSTDTLAGLGPAPLRTGDRLPVGPVPGREVHVDHAVHRVAGGAPGSLPSGEPDVPVRLHVVIGPDDDQVGPAGLDVLLGATFTVSPAIDRIGVRLTGPRVPRPPADGRASTPLVRGAVQLPPDGQPVVMGPDHPVTGGYPVPVVVIDADTDACAQLRPGALVRLHPASLTTRMAQ